MAGQGGQRGAARDGAAAPAGGPGRLVVEAPAKLNLYLEVRGRRDDGYHELVTVLHAVDLVDTLELSLRERRPDLPADEPDVTLELVQGSDLPGLELVPTDERNLAVAAARRLLRHSGAAAETGLHLRLVKRIPPGGGLGGGSSDAAAVLTGLDALLGSPCDEGVLRFLAAELGSDVPFFLEGGTALCLGRGEHVLPIAPPRPLEAWLALPGFPVPTPAVYGALGAPPLEGPPFRALAHDSLPAAQRPLLAALADAGTSTLAGLLRNDLEPAAVRVEPRLAPLLAVDGAHLCGSGSSLFSLGPRNPWEAVAVRCPSIRFVPLRSKNR